MDAARVKQIEVRRLAAIRGERYYHGSACRICGSTLRYVACGRCRQCMIRKSTRGYERRRDAKREAEGG